VNGTKVTNGSDLYRILDQCKVGETVSFCFFDLYIHVYQSGNLTCLIIAKILNCVVFKVTVEVLRGDHKEKIPVVLEPKADES
jgi:hypothetical protein